MFRQLGVTGLAVLGSYRGYIGMMENKIETSIMGYIGFSV